MVRILNFVCVALMGFTILALYHVSEKTRVAHMELAKVNAGIAQEHSTIGVLETEWQHVASPEHIQQLAQARLGMADTASFLAKLKENKAVQELPSGLRYEVIKAGTLNDRSLVAPASEMWRSGAVSPSISSVPTI